MKIINIFSTVIVCTVLACSSFAMGGNEQGVEQSKKQDVCPVMGGKVNPEYYADVEGKRIYVCCPGCIAAIESDPSKYISEMQAKGIALQDVPQN